MLEFYEILSQSVHSQNQNAKRFFFFYIISNLNLKFKFLNETYK